WAATALGQMGVAAKDAAPALREALGSDPILRDLAARTLGLLASQSGQGALVAASALVPGRTADGGQGRAHLAWALCLVEGRASLAIPVFLEVMGGYGEFESNETIEVLNLIGPQDSGSVPALAEALKAKGPAARLWAAQALGRIGPEARL